MKKLFSIQTQLITLLLPAVFVLSIVLPLVFFELVSTELEKTILEDNIHDIATNGNRIQQEITGDRNLILALQRVPPIQGIIRAQPTGYDEEDTSSLEQWCTRLAVIFRSHIEANTTIGQLRFIDENGNEIVRVVQSGSTVVRFPEAALQNKGDRPYFTQTMQLPANAVYTSRTELNQEYGSIQEPYNPVMRIALPVFDPTGVRKGIIIGNFRTQQIFNNFSRSAYTSFYVIDHEGYIIQGPNPEELYGLDLGHPEHTIEKHLPGILQLIQSTGTGSFSGVNTQSEFIWQRVVYNPSDPEGYWTFITSVDRNALLTPIKNLRSIIVAASLIIAFVLTSLVIFTAQSIASPLKKLTLSARAAATGNINTNIPEIGTHREILILSRTLRRMQENLQNTNIELEEKVTGRTEELQKALSQQKESNIAMLNIMEDLEDSKKRIEEEIRNTKKFQLAVEGSDDGVVFTNANREVVYANSAWQHITGYSLKEAYGKKANILTSEKTPQETLAKIREALQKAEPFHSDEFINKRKDGSLYNADLTTYPVFGPTGLEYWVGVQRDITARKREDAAKAEFISLASHQLRTPLTTIKWIFEMFKKGKVGKMDAFQKELLDDAETCARHMSESIATMLTLSRIEAGKLHPSVTPISLCTLLSEIATTYKIIIEERGQNISMQCGEEITFESDHALLTEIVGNLVSNASKYSPKGGSVTLSGSKKNDRICIDVTDTGMGIPLHQQSKVFTKFFRAENAQNSQTEGTGLGLYLVQSIANLLGGSVSFTSAEGQGTTFTLTLPPTPPQDAKS